MEQYGSKYPNYIYPLVAVNMGLAIATGVARMGANKHYWEDVLAGAIVGAGLATLNYYVFVVNDDSHYGKNPPSTSTAIVSLGGQF